MGEWYGVVLMSKSNKERQAELKARREAQGQVRRPYWGTPTEHEAINALLAELRRSS